MSDTSKLRPDLVSPLANRRLDAGAARAATTPTSLHVIRPPASNPDPRDPDPRDPDPRNRPLRARLGAALAGPVAVAAMAMALVVNPVATPEAEAATHPSAETLHKLYFQVAKGTSFRAGAAAIAIAQRGKPYRYGSTGPGSFDCSGLTSFSYAAVGKVIPRTSSAQRNATVAVHRNDMEPGDLLFYSGHVAMYAGFSDGGHWMVEAPRSGHDVRVIAMRNEGLRKIGRVRA